jgi:glucose/arabinose dehydrogenase
LKFIQDNLTLANFQGFQAFLAKHQPHLINEAPFFSRRLSTAMLTRPTRLFAAFLLAALLARTEAQAQDTFSSDDYDLTVTPVAEGLDHPWGLAFLPDGEMLVTERRGRLRLVARDGEVSAPVQGVPSVYASGQGGLLDVALDPAFPENGLIYLSYAEAGDGGAGTAVARARLDRDALTLADLQVIFRQVPKTSGGRHFGSRLVFDRQGHLFITLGERGERERAQDTSVNRGQVVRIWPDGSIPEDNPFVGQEGHRPEIWSYGHRNPQGAVLNPWTGALWTVEHGAAGGDEINIPQAGRNYGWPVIAYGRHYSGGKIGVGTEKEGMEQPLYYWDPSIAPGGADFYDGAVFEAWRGNLFVAALKFRLLVRLELKEGKVVKEERLLEGLGARIRDVRQGPDGFLYLLTDESDGAILRLQPAD